MKNVNSKSLKHSVSNRNSYCISCSISSTGPDHLAALLPRCCGQKWYKAGRIGALWGMGHGVSATLLGITAFGLKNRLSNMPAVKGLLIGASSAMEIAVGASLILIGLLGNQRVKRIW